MSCRRGVPDRCSCLNSLAEKVRELWERCANAIKSINGINPDGANNFDILPGAGIQVNPRANGIEIVATGAAPEGLVESVNGISPDEDGDVQINTGLLTVNGEAPDADGEFSISAGSGIQINAGTNGIEIENTSQGAIYTGVSPIDVNADNEISLKDWTKVNDNDWSIYNDGTQTTKELYILISKELSVISSNKCYFHGLIYIPKGTPVSKTISVTAGSGGSTTTYGTVGEIYNTLSGILNTSSTASLQCTALEIDIATGSGINQTIRIGFNKGSVNAIKRSEIDLYYR